MARKPTAVVHDNPLARYKAATDKTDQEIADELGIAREMVVKYRRGDRSPSLETAFKIEERSRGTIPAHSWRGAAA